MGPKPVTFHPNSVLLNFLFFFVALPPTLHPKLGIFNLSSPLLPTPWHNGSYSLSVLAVECYSSVQVPNLIILHSPTPRAALSSMNHM